ncbi:tRNA methyltransferase [Aureococcus anophagefferens]|nr:tRNA methyltransferase [Aureococcus anophagefferens]
MRLVLQLLLSLQAASLAPYRVTFVKPESVAGVPCILAPPSLAKSSLALLRRAGWHPPRHLRRVDGDGRAYQLSDAGALALAAMLDDDAGAAADGGSATNNARGGRLRDGATRRGERARRARARGPPALGAAAPDPRAARRGRAPRRRDEGHFVRHLPEGEAPAPRTPRVVTFAELFAGIGGFRAGLEAAAGAPPAPAVACEILESARRIYAANFGAESLTAAPVQRLDRLPACDLLMAGFPCQSYTEQAGKRRRGFRDPRGQLFWHVIRLLAASEMADRPEALLLENARERVYIVAIRADLAAARRFRWPALERRGPRSIRDVLEDPPDAERHRVPRALYRSVVDSAYHAARPRARFPDVDGPANTVRATYRRSPKLFSQFVPLAGGDPPWRFLTPREVARLQGFPDDFALDAADEADQYAAIGNAVSPPVVEALCGALLDALG